MPGEPRDVRALLTFLGKASGTPTNYFDVGDALVFKCYDSATHGGTARFGAHTAFADPTSPDGARTRESIEVRTIALFH